MKTKSSHHFFRLTGRIDANLYQRFEKFCDKTPSNDPTQTLCLLFHCKGGDLGYASKIVEKINSLAAYIITVSHGSVHSSAVPIFASGKLRLAKDFSDKFLFHRAELTEGVSQKELEDGERSVFESIADCIGVSTSYIYELANAGTYIDANKAVEIGLVHKVMKIKPAA